MIMKKINIFLLALVLGLLLSCEKNDNGSKIYSILGKAQKGPFITGTNVSLYELNSDFNQTGKSFTTTITTDDGSFSLSNIELKSNLALLSANGFYFSEIYGELSEAALSLQALADLSEKESVNINVLTHVIKGRIENLVAGGLGLHDANEQAKSEFLNFLGVSGTSGTDFDNLDISVDDEYNAVLLSFSTMLQRYTITWNEKQTLTAKLTQLLSDLSSDFASDGIISNQNLIDTLLFNISQLHLTDIRNNIEKRYSDLGQTVTIPGFEKYIAKFQEKHSDLIYSDFTYPDSASPYPVINPESSIPNILNLTETVYKTGGYSVAAIIPLNTSLKIKFIGSNINIGGPKYGWELNDLYSGGFTLKSQRQNNLMSLLVHLEGFGNAIIEYYENDSEVPSFSKNIIWE